MSNRVVKFTVNTIDFINSSLIAVWTHKRRSLAIVSGMVLSGAIITGMVIYSNILLVATYDSIIENTPFEVRFDGPQDQSTVDMTDFKNQLLQKPQVSAASVIVGSSKMQFTSSTTSSTVTSKKLVIQFPQLQKASLSIFDFSGCVLVGNDFIEGLIGQRIASTLTSGNFTLRDNHNGLILPSNIADSYGLKVGDVVNISLGISREIGSADEEISFSGIVIQGVYASSNQGGGVMGAAISETGIFDSVLGSVIGSIDLLAGEEGQTFLTEMRNYGMEYVAVKIDETSGYFDLTNIGSMAIQIQTWINEVEKEFLDDEITGGDTVTIYLALYSVTVIFLMIFDILLAIPTVILSIYLMILGAEIAMRERKYEIAIEKVQGASQRQISRLIMGETLVLFIVGLIIAYVLGTGAAWLTSSAVGYMRFDLAIASQFLGQWGLDFGAIQYLVIFTGVILFWVTSKKAKEYVELEVSSGIKRVAEEKEGFMHRNSLDIIFFGIGLITFLLVMLDQVFNINLQLGIISAFLILFGPFLFWIGGASLVGRLAKSLPSKIESILLRLAPFKDVRRIIKAGLERKSAYSARIALLISLAVSFSMLAAIQGVSGEMHVLRATEWEQGADIQARPFITLSSIKDDVNNSIGAESISAISLTIGTILFDQVAVIGVDDTYIETGVFHPDSIVGDAEAVFQDLTENPLDTIIIGKEFLEITGYEPDQQLKLKVEIIYWNGTGVTLGTREANLRVVAAMDHCPGGIGANDAIVSNKLIHSFYNITEDDLTNFLAGTGRLVPSLNTSYSDDFVFASSFLIKCSENLALVKDKLLEMDYIESATTMEEEIGKIKDLSKATFGVPGLLSIDFIISVLAAVVGTFIFVSIVLDARKREFALLRASGASRSQLMKIAFLEMLSILFFALIAGALLGICLALLFNAYFEFFAVFTTSTLESSITRLVIIPLDGIIATLAVIFIAITAATFLPALKAAKVNIASEVKVI
ncbi:MAG: FtsX-like permease family protein [Candidatus Hodarchaeales archaeon]|jgi:ABC-type antimicrobial peptide transport system permease subunit